MTIVGPLKLNCFCSIDEELYMYVVCAEKLFY